MTGMTIEKVLKILRDKEYRNAKTYKRVPHSYTLKKNWNNKKEFELAVAYIQRHGKREKFFSKTYPYLYGNGYKYFVYDIDTPVNEYNKAEVINRKPI